MKTSIIPPPDEESRWQKIRRQAPSLLLSLALHAAILGPLCMITWVVVATVAQEPVLNLAPENAGAAKSAGGDETAEGAEGVGEPGGAAGKGNDNWGIGARNNALSIPKLGGVAGQGPWSDLSSEGGGGLPGFEGPSVGNPFGEASGDATGSLIRNLYGKSAGIPGGGGMGRGGDLVYGTGEGFSKYIGDLRGTGMDLVLVLDATDSMNPHIRNAKQRLQDVLKVVTALVPNLRIGMVAYKDYGDEYGPSAVKPLPLTADANVVRAFLDGIVAGGGGDEPEPIHAALRAAMDQKGMKWIGGRKWVIILVGDSTIHASGRQEAFDLAKRFAQGRGTINVVDVGGSGQQVNIRQQVLPDLDRIAKEGGGSAFLLREEKDFWQHLIVSVFGQRFKEDVDTIIGRVLGKGSEP